MQNIVALKRRSYIICIDTKKEDSAKLIGLSRFKGTNEEFVLDSANCFETISYRFLFFSKLMAFNVNKYYVIFSKCCLL